MKKFRTGNSSSSCFVTSCELPSSALPTLREVLGNVILEKEKLSVEEKVKDVRLNEVIDKVYQICSHSVQESKFKPPSYK